MTDLLQPIRTATLTSASTDEMEGIGGESLSPFQQALRHFRRDKLAMGSLIVLTLIGLTVLFAPLVAPYGERDLVGDPRTDKIGYLTPRADYWLGTDDLGHDLLSRIIWGGRVSLAVGLGVAVIGCVIGTLIGSIAGFRGGLMDDLLMRVTDIFLAFPLIVSLSILRKYFGTVGWLTAIMGEPGTIRFMVILLSIVSWMGVARIVRGVVLSLKEREFVEASRAIGASNVRIVARHLIPNALGPIIVALTVSVVGAILAESTLAFFGLGVEPGEGQTSWGLLLRASKLEVQSGRWWLVVFPATIFVITVLTINFIGDGLRDAFDPKKKVRS